MRTPYPTDLSDAESHYIEPHMPASKGYGSPRTHDLPEILDAVFCALKSGCQWRLLPHDFPRDGLPSITISELGVSTAAGRGSTGPYENA
jgi:transposase